MLNHLKIIACLLLMQFATMGGAYAQERGTADQAKALVEKGITHIKAVGVEKAAQDFSNKDGKWHETDLYIFVQKFDGNTIAHGGNKGLVGKNMIGLKDANGQTFIRTMIDTAKNKGNGWVDYVWTNPQSKKVEPKSTYVVKIPDYEGLIGVGIYK
jgi:hypothetical protein